jgi:hypothetical protein
MYFGMKAHIGADAESGLVSNSKPTVSTSLDLAIEI